MTFFSSYTKTFIIAVQRHLLRSHRDNRAGLRAAPKRLISRSLGIILVLTVLQPAYAANYPVAGRFTVVPIPSTAKPGYLEYYIDPVFNSTVQRITDMATFYPPGQPQPNDNVLAHVYSSRQAWNADGSLLFLGARHPGWLLEGNTFARIRQINQLSDAVWSNTQPNIMYGFYQTPDGKYHQFHKMDVMRGDAATLIANFPAYDNMQIGGYVGELDNNDNYVALTGVRSDGSRWLILYSIAKNAVIAEQKMGATFRYAYIAQSGKYIVISHAARGKGKFRGVHVYRNNDFGVPVGRVAFPAIKYLGQLAQEGSGDVGVDTAGRDVYVQYGGKGASGSVLMWRLKDGVKTSLLPSSPKKGKASGVWGGHISCRNIKRPGWCYLSDNGWEPQPGKPAGRFWYGNDEIYALKLNKSRTVQRFAHMHHSYFEPKYLKTLSRQDQNRAYEHSTLGAPDRFGVRVLFRSDWNNANIGAEVNSYVAYY